jgi:hypothetical protein
MTNPKVSYTHFVWRLALSHVNECAGEDSVRAHMTPPLGGQPQSLITIYEYLLNSLRNRQAMVNTIGPLERLAPVLFYFDPHSVIATFGKDWTALLAAIQKHLKVRVNPENKRSYWVHFAKGALDGAKFLNQFSGADEFQSFVEDFYEKPTTRPALPMLVAQEIHGFGFPLACDFLKEIGYTQYAKPDVHVINLFSELGFASTNDLEVYRAVCKFAEAVGETPFAVDKVFWLLGSGNLYLENRKFPTSRAEFIERVKDEWHGLSKKGAS